MWRRPPLPFSERLALSCRRAAAERPKAQTQPTSPIAQSPASSKPAAAASPSPAPTSPASAASPSPARPPLARQTAHTASSRSPTRTHTSRPRAKALASHYSARDIQERRPVRSRFQSQPGQAREADSRPGPLLPTTQKEHWSTACSATPTTRDQAHSFYRR